MAVIQISKIRVRRGKENSGSGLPQLSGGEFGWAIDTQNLFIGNGDSSEGAPFTGNTKVLTEHDNILDYVQTYQYQPTSTLVGTVSRTLQARLDDEVSVHAFGAVGDGVTDDTIALQNAFNIFRTPGFGGYGSENPPSHRERVTLIIEPGTYLVSDTLQIPPFATIVGAGIDKTVIQATGTFPVFETVNTNGDNIGTTEFTQSRNVFIAALTIISNGGNCINLHSCRDSMFVQLKLSGTWLPGDILGTESAIYMDAVNSQVTCSNLGFSDCTVEGLSYFVDANYDINNVTFSHMDVKLCGFGFNGGYALPIGSVDGQQYGPRYCKIIDSHFYNVGMYAIYIKTGTKNTSDGNTYIGCGNNGTSESTAQCNVIYFGQVGNKSNDFFSRSELTTGTASYIPEIGGHGSVKIDETHELQLNIVNTVTTAIRLPLIGYQDVSLVNSANGFIKLHYTYMSSAIVRNGTMSIAVSNGAIKMTEEYDVIGTLSVSDELIFSATIDTAINVRYTSNEIGTIRYWFEYSI